MRIKPILLVYRRIVIRLQKFAFVTLTIQIYISIYWQQIFIHTSPIEGQTLLSFNYFYRNTLFYGMLFLLQLGGS